MVHQHYMFHTIKQIYIQEEQILLLVLLPTPSAVTGYTFNGWYTEATGGTKVIAANKTVQASVSGWTDASKKWLLTSTSNNATTNVLYAHYTANELNFTQSDVTVTYNTSETTYNISAATNGTGSYTYAVSDGNIGNYFSMDGNTLKIKAKTPSNTNGYAIKVKATDNNSGSTKEVSFKVIVNKATPTVTLTAKTEAQRTYTGSSIAANTATVTLKTGDTFSNNITYTYYNNSSCTTGASTTAPTGVTTKYAQASIAALDE